MKLPGLQVCGWSVLLLSAACTAPREGNELPKNPVAGKARLFVGDTGDAPPGCDIPAVVDHVSRFFKAIDRGEAQVAERFFTDGKTTPFVWFSFTDPDPGGPGHFATYTRDGLDDHFAARHGAGDRFRLRAAKLIGYVPERGTVGLSPLLFDYSVIELMTNSRVWHYGTGKGEYHCETRRFTNGWRLAGLRPLRRTRRGRLGAGEVSVVSKALAR